jgi:hypothetical protein
LVSKNARTSRRHSQHRFARSSDTCANSRAARTLTGANKSITLDSVRATRREFEQQFRGADFSGDLAFVRRTIAGRYATRPGE